MFTKSTLFPKNSATDALRASSVRSTSSSGSFSGRGSEADGSPVASSPTLAAASRPEETARTRPASAAGADGASRLIVGPEVKLKGAEILDCDTLVVEGRVEATMDSRVLRIAENGSFAGTVGIDVAEIHGSFDGELTARQQLVIHGTGKVSGKIRYGKILIEEGGELSGDVQALARAGAPRGAGSTEGAAAGSKPLAAVAG